MRKWTILLILILNLSLIQAQEIRFIKPNYSESFQDLYKYKITEIIEDFSVHYNLSVNRLKINIYALNPHMKACGWTILGSRMIQINSDIECLLGIKDVLVHELQHYRWARIDKRAYYFNICKKNDVSLRDC